MMGSHCRQLRNVASNGRATVARAVRQSRLECKKLYCTMQIFFDVNGKVLIRMADCPTIIMKL